MSVYRLKNRANFVALSQSGMSEVTPAFVMQWLPSRQEQGLYIGYTASKRSIGNAVARNRARRRLKAAVREVLKDLPHQHGQLVLIARHRLKNYDFDRLKSDLKKAYQTCCFEREGHV